MLLGLGIFLILINALFANIKCIIELFLFSVDIKRQEPIVCQFEAPISDRTHSKPEVVKVHFRFLCFSKIVEFLFSDSSTIVVVIITLTTTIRCSVQRLVPYSGVVTPLYLEPSFSEFGDTSVIQSDPLMRISQTCSYCVIMNGVSKCKKKITFEWLSAIAFTNTVACEE